MDTAPSFVYPRNPDILVTHCTNVLMKATQQLLLVEPTNLVPHRKRLPLENLYSRHMISCIVVHTMWLNRLTLLWIKSLRMSLKTGIFKHCKHAHLWVLICMLVLGHPNTSIIVTTWCNKFASICYISIGLLFSHLQMLKHECYQVLSKL